MSSAQASFNEPISSSVGRLVYLISVATPDGQPVAGEEVIFSLEGDGSLSPSLSSKQIKRETDANGRAVVTWYRRSIFDRAVHGTFTAESTRPELLVALDLMPSEEAARMEGPRINWAPHSLAKYKR